MLNGTGVIGATSLVWNPPASAWGSLFGCELVGVNSAGQSLPTLAQEVFVGLVDVLSVQPIEANEFHRMRAGHTGKACVVRNSSNAPATQDKPIGFSVTGAFDTNALLNHVGAGNGTIVELLGQMGNNKDKKQTVAVNQPRIANSGVIETLNTRPTMRLLSGAMNLSTGLNENRRAVIAVVRHDTIADFAGVWGSNSDFGLRVDAGVARYRSAGGDMADAGGFNRLNGTQTGDPNPTANISAGVAHIIGAQNGSSRGPFIWSLGGYFAGRFMNGAISAIMEFDVPPTENDWKIIEGNWSARYSISVVP